MNYKKLIYLFVILTNTAYAESGEYQLYSCQNDVKASLKCEACIKSEGISFTFKVQPLNNTVLKTTYKNNEIQSDDALKNCKVVDAKNWQCDESEGNLVATKKMSNGIYRTLLAYKGAIATCAKKKSFFD